MPHPNEERVRTAYRALDEKNYKSAASLIADDAVWHFGGRTPLSGDYRGRDAILDLFTTLGRDTNGTLHVTVHDVLANDGPDPANIPLGHAIALLRVYAERGDDVLDVMGAQILHFRDGTVAEGWFLPNDQHAIEEFWASVREPVGAAAPLSERGRRGF